MKINNKIKKSPVKSVFFFSFHPTRTPPNYVDAHPVEKERKLRPSDHPTVLFRRCKTPSLQPLRPERKSVPIPVECLDHVSGPIEKDKERPVHRIIAKLAPDNSGKPIKSLAHVNGTSVEKDPARRPHADHTSASATRLRSAASNSRSIRMTKRPASTQIPSTGLSSFCPISRNPRRVLSWAFSLLSQ